MDKTKRYYAQRVIEQLQNDYPNQDLKIQERDVFPVLDDVVNKFAEKNYFDNWQLAGTGIDEVGKSPYALLSQSPVSAGWDSTIPPWGNYAGFKFPDFFTKGIRVVAPVLKSGSWTTNYIDSFLDEINTTNLVCLMGWSWGGQGTGDYLNQVTKKYSFKCGVLMSKSGSSIGSNVSCPVKLIHAVNDSKCQVSNSDKFYSGVPEQFKVGYERPSSGDHFVWKNLLEPKTGIYEWIKSFAIPSVPVEDVLGTLVKRGESIYGIFNGEEILIK